MDHNAILQQLNDLAEPDYRQFMQKLVPNTDGILGVRLPHLRKMAKQIAREDFGEWLDHIKSPSYETRMLRGMVIGYRKAGYEETMEQIEAFLPQIDNWAVCDSFCSGLTIKEHQKDSFWDFLEPFYSLNDAYRVRFAVVMLMNQYIEPNRMEGIFERLLAVSCDDYYVVMAVAWTISECFVADPKRTRELLNNPRLDRRTGIKAIQKILESRRVDEATKSELRERRTALRGSTPF